MRCANLNLIAGVPVCAVAVNVPASPAGEDIMQISSSYKCVSLVVALGAICSATVTLSPAADWPQHQHDAARTGYSPDRVDPPYRTRWVWLNGQGLQKGPPPYMLTRARDTSGSMQVVVADGKVFFGTTEGVFYALDAGTGAELWRYEVGWPIVATAAFADGKVVFTCQDKHVYCLSGEGGQLAWKFRTGAGIWTAPAIRDGRVFVTSRDCGAYALDLATGKQIWKADTSGPILTTPAVAGGKVFLGSEDCCAYAFDARTGKQLWKTPLPGGSFYMKWPVPVGEVVFFRMMPQYAALETDQEAERRLADVGDAGWPAEREAILAHLAKHPTRKTLFSLDTETGREKYTVPMLMAHANGCVPCPPVVAPGRRVYTIFRVGKSSLFHGAPTFGTRFACDVSRIDLETGDRVRLPLRPVKLGVGADNTGELSIGGGIMFVDHRYFVSKAFDLKTGRFYPLIMNRESEATPPRSPNWLWTREQAPNHPSTETFTPHRGYGVWGVSPAVIAAGRVYCNQLGGAIVCLDGGKTEDKP